MHFIFVLLIISSCKPAKVVVEEVISENKTPECVLSFLPKTKDYKNQIDNYLSIYKDTIFEIESIELGKRNYSSVIELRAEEYYLWLLKTENQKIDSLLIHSIAPNKSVDAEFELDTCRIEIETNEYDEIGNPISGSTDFIKM